MELVYLWVEDYKNIKKQGFNFSPRFKCEFIPIYENFLNESGLKKERIGEDSTLRIFDKKETNESYMENLFGKNLNISLIVGENGSGKTSILEIIYDFFGSHSEKTFLIFNKEGKYFVYYNHRLNIDIKDSGESISFINERGKSNIAEIYEVYNNENNKFISNKKNENLVLTSNNKSHFKANLLKAYFYTKKKDILNKLFEINYIELIIEYDNLKKDISNYKEDIQEKIKDNISFIEGTVSSIVLFKGIFEILRLKYNINNLKDEYIKEYKKKYPSKVDNMTGYFFEEVVYQDLKRHKFNINKSRNRHYIYIDIEEDLKKIDFIFSLPSIAFNIHLYDKNHRSFDNLSFGEQKLLSTLYTFENILQNESYEVDGWNEEYPQSIEMNYFLIDEFELGLHPQWQKETINRMISFFSQGTKEKHLFLTSHSPFFLSDIPKENVIFLEEGKQVYPFENGQTFGTNIHTLLSHGFFMKDGLMGEFAKGKIQSIIKYHQKIIDMKLEKDGNKNQKEDEKKDYESKYKKKFKQIQSIIGDDYLKQVVKNHLVEIEKILYDDFLIDNEITSLQKQIDNLNELKNKNAKN